MTDQAQQAILQGAMGVAIALAIGYVLYRIIKTKDSPSKASDYGRNWMAWIVMISTMATLPNAINNPSPDTIAKGVVALIVFSLIAFLVGFAYGKFKLRKTNTSTNKPTTNKTVTNTDMQSNKTICSECGAEIKPANAKFCGHCGAKVERPKQVASKTINAEVVKPPTIEKQVVNNDKTPTPVKPVQTTSQSKPLTKHTKSKAITRSDSSPYKAIIITFIVLAVFVVALQKYNTYSNNTPYGTFTYDNGDVYTGELKNGKPTFKDGYQFKTSLERAKNRNEIIENLKNNITESKGNDFSNTKNINKEEYAKYKKTNNSSPSTYNNKSTNKTSYSEGTFTTPDGATYKGELKDGIQHGIGTYTWSNGDSYNGEWIDGNFDNSHGIYTWSNGDSYEGEWLDGKRNGYGVYTSLSYGVYKGSWKNGNKHGQGMQINGGRGGFTYKSYNGKWKDGDEHGVGVITLHNGYSGIARFENGQKVEDL